MIVEPLGINGLFLAHRFYFSQNCIQCIHKGVVGLRNLVLSYHLFFDSGDCRFELGSGNKIFYQKFDVFFGEYGITLADENFSIKNDLGK